MTNNYFLAVATLIALSGCGKSLSLTQKASGAPTDVTDGLTVGKSAGGIKKYSPAPTATPDSGSGTGSLATNGTDTLTGTSSLTTTDTGTDTGTSTFTGTSTHTQTSTSGLVSTGASAGTSTKTSAATNTSTSPNASDATFDGLLTPLSTFDLSEMNNVMPYLNTESKDKGTRAVGSPAWTTDGPEDDREGFVKQSNLVFRAIKLIPSMELIQSIDSLQLKFANVRIFVPKGQTLQAVLGAQTLCVLDTKECAGPKPAPDKNLNANFWTGSRSHSVSLFTTSQFEHDDSIKLDDGDVYEADSVTINLVEVFALNDQTVEQWIFDSSKAFDKSSYRKFRFVMGNNFYASAGELQVVTINTMPNDAAVVHGAPNNGSDDLTFVRSAAPASVLSGQPIAKTVITMNETSLPFAPGKSKLVGDSVAKLKRLAVVLKKFSKNIAGVRILGRSDMDLRHITKKANIRLALNRAKSVKAQFVHDKVKLKMQVIGTMAKTSTCAPNLPCPADRRVSIELSYKSVKDMSKLAPVKEEIAKEVNEIFPQP